MLNGGARFNRIRVVVAVIPAKMLPTEMLPENRSMTAKEIVGELSKLGAESIKKVLRNHAVQERFFGLLTTILITLG